MEAKHGRRYTFLKNKYNELLLPTLFMVMSEKICTVVDVIIIGFILGSVQLSVVNLAAPMTYITGIFYILFGQGGSLLALRAQSQLKHEKVNYYFTLSVLGIIIVTIIYILLIFLFADQILMLFNIPENIFNIGKGYLLMLMFLYPLNCYILVVSFFIRADGFPKMPFYAVLISNILNIILDIIFLKVFHMGIVFTALASVLGYLVGAIYISTYFLKKNGTFKLVSLAKFKIKEILLSIKEIIFNTPEVIGKIFFALKISMLTYLCSTYWGVAGLLAFLVYDNSETFVYIFLSGIMKTMSPIVAVLHKERDYESVKYIISRSVRIILLISFPISALLFIYPEILLILFNIVDPYQSEVVSVAIRITAFSLVGRCMSYLLANYAQAIEYNRISSIITFLEEFLFAVLGALLFTRMIGGIGIWISILIAECVPVLVYIIYTFCMNKTYKDEIHRIFMLQDSNLVTLTYNRYNIGKIDNDDLDSESYETVVAIENYLKDDGIILSNSINDICKNIFENIPDLEDIDITIRLIKDELRIALTTDGARYNPFSNDKLMKSKNIEELSKLNCRFEFDEILGFNKSYIIFKKEKRD